MVSWFVPWGLVRYLLEIMGLGGWMFVLSVGGLVSLYPLAQVKFKERVGGKVTRGRCPRCVVLGFANPRWC